MLGGQFQVHAGGVTIGRSVLDPKVGQGDLAVYDSEVMLSSNLLLPVAGLLFGQPAFTADLRVDPRLEFVVEDDAFDLATLLLDPFGLGFVDAVERGVVSEFARFDEPGVEFLGLVVSEGTLPFDQVLALLGEGDEASSVAVTVQRAVPSLNQALLG